MPGEREYFNKYMQELMPKKYRKKEKQNTLKNPHTRISNQNTERKNEEN